MKTLPTLGVGIVYSSGLDPLLISNDPLVDLVEIEPQTFWQRLPTAPHNILIDERALAHIAALPFPKLLHGVGFPVGGTIPPDPIQGPLLRRMIDVLNVPWMSEHLSFNHALGSHGRFLTGFLLPPRQTVAGAEAAIRSIASMASEISVPLAVETGVNYLRPLPDELADGEFVARVAEGADCGILLDLHNLWANERNGRQSVADFVSGIPLDRVWEVHLAGGADYRGHWLDEHGGPVPPALLDLAGQLLPSLPNLRAIIFEILPAHLERVGLDLVKTQVKAIRRLWDERGHGTRRVTRQTQPSAARNPQEKEMTPEEWEHTLGKLVVGFAEDGPTSLKIANNPGVALLRTLVEDFRSTVIVEVLRLTSRFLILRLGAEGARELLRQYCSLHTPELFASAEAESFAAFLRTTEVCATQVEQIMTYELAIAATSIDGKPRTVRFTYPPIPFLEALAKGHLPPEEASGLWDVEIGREGSEDRGERRCVMCPH